MRRCTVGAAIATLLTACATSARPGDVANGHPSIEARVHRAVLEDIAGSSRTPGPLVAVRELTQWGHHLDSSAVWQLFREATSSRYRSPGVYGLSRDLYASFLRANGQTGTLSSSLVEGLPITPERRRTVANGPATGNAIHLSRVGTNAAGDSALVYVGIACQGLCGRSEIALYVRGAAGWRKAGQLMFAHH